MDFRLQGKTLEWLQENGYFGDCDVISNAGSAKVLADGSPDAKEFILNEIGLSCEKHGVKNIIIIHHSDCGAYTTHDLKTPEEEKAKQLKDMEIEKSLIKERFPEVTIIKVWAQMKDLDGKEVDFQIVQ
ncbi:hypothetical protein M0R01_04365 [bacterium]|nr:hypothetical protein [bacterium]